AAQIAVSEMGLEGRYAELERERLARLAREWLEVERRRAPFEIQSLEEERELNVAGMQFKSRIDRMDKLQRGGHVLIDYKTGMPKHSAARWPRATHTSIRKRISRPAGAATCTRSAACTRNFQAWRPRPRRDSP